MKEEIEIHCLAFPLSNVDRLKSYQSRSRWRCILYECRRRKWYKAELRLEGGVTNRLSANLHLYRPIKLYCTPNTCQGTNNHSGTKVTSGWELSLWSRGRMITAETPGLKLRIICVMQSFFPSAFMERRLVERHFQLPRLGHGDIKLACFMRRWEQSQR